MGTFRFSVKHPLAPEEFRAMVDDERYADLRFDAYHAEEISKRMTTNHGRTQMTLVGKPDIRYLSPIIRPFASDNVTITINEMWSPMQGTTCQATTVLTTSCFPASIRLSQIVEQYGTGCIRYFEGTVLVDNDPQGMIAKNLAEYYLKLRRYARHAVGAYLEKYGTPQVQA